MKNALSGLVWVLLYLFFCLAPLVLAAGQQQPPGRPFLVEFSVALGFVGLSILALQFALIGRFKPVAAPFGIDALLQYHVQITLVALTFVLAHPVLLFVADSHKYLPLLNLITAPWRARFAVTSVIALLVLAGLSVWRRRLHLRYEVWQATHGILAVVVVLLALLHASLVGYYITGLLRHVVYDGYIGVLIFLLLWIRVLSPLKRLRHPWRVVRVDAERGDTSTLVIEPVGHEGFRFDPGQFGWIAVGRSPFARTQHPFSFSSAADVPAGGPVTMTIKAAGDFTKTVPAVTPGTRVYVDGPHGVFSMDRRQAPGYVFIAGGVGVTPLYSMVLTMREREDVRPVTLFYASVTWEDVVFREELAELSDKMPNLKVIHVLDRPPEGWTGESGFITADMLRRHLPAQYRRYEYMICGSARMMDAMEDALVAVGVPFGQVSTERFDMV
jgi:predicted ferric reductase